MRLGFTFIFWLLPSPSSRSVSPPYSRNRMYANARHGSVDSVNGNGVGELEVEVEPWNSRMEIAEMVRCRTAGRECSRTSCGYFWTVVVVIWIRCYGKRACRRTELAEEGPRWRDEESLATNTETIAIAICGSNSANASNLSQLLSFKITAG